MTTVAANYNKIKIRIKWTRVIYNMPRKARMIMEVAMEA